jgi:PKD repeat protein/uncharacterized protein (AIM24 family)
MFKKFKIFLASFLLLLPFFLVVIGSLNVVEASSVPERLFSTYFGGSDTDTIYDVATDSEGNFYVTGSTLSRNFPVLNAFEPIAPDRGNAFLSKFSSDGSLVFSTYLGGLGSDGATAIAVDHSGNIYITGNTKSQDFPVLNGYQNNLKGGQDIFVAKFSSSGSLLYSSYLGSIDSDYENATDIAVDDFGNFYIVGNTSSSTFPILNATQSGYGGGSYDMFISKFSADGALAFSTYLGGLLNDQGTGIAVDTFGNAYITGLTASNNFPTRNAYQNYNNGINDVVITKLSSDGSLDYSTYFGGVGGEVGIAIATDIGGNAYVIGNTGPNFPLYYPFQAFMGISDVFITKFSGSGSLVYSSYLGGSGADQAGRVAVDPEGNAYVAGTTWSSNFPLRYPQPMTAYENAFVAKIANTGGSVTYSVFSDGGADVGNGIVLDNTGDLYLVGYTQSLNFPLVNPYQTTIGGGPYDSGRQDGFISKFGFNNQPPVPSAGIDQIVNEGQSVAFDGSGSTDPDGNADINSFYWDFGDGSTGSGAVVNHAYADNGSYIASLTVIDTANHTSSDTTTVTVNNVGPVVGSLSPISSILPGVSVSTNADFSDAGILDTHTAAFDWGDGVVTQGAMTESNGSGNISGSHTYSQSGIYAVTLTVIDKDGGTSSSLTNVTILTPAQAIQNLTDLVQTYNLQQGIENSLDQKLQNAVDSLTAENSGNRQDAINKLQAFISAVQAQSGNQITVDQANVLIQDAQEIIDILTS